MGEDDLEANILEDTICLKYEEDDPVPITERWKPDSDGKRKHIYRKIEQKLRVVNEAKLIGGRNAARKFGIAHSTIHNWMQREEKLNKLVKQGLGATKNELTRQGKHQHRELLERELLKWIQKQGTERKVSYLDIRSRALAIYKENNLTFRPFRCSSEWIKKFIKKFNLQQSSYIDFDNSDSELHDYSCEVCGKSFEVESALKTHSTLHTEAKEHVCTYCANGYVHKKDLIIHERKHTGERPFACQVCGKQFYDPSNMKKHEKSHYSIQV